jgi:hypothetical protein
MANQVHDRYLVSPFLSLQDNTAPNYALHHEVNDDLQLTATGEPMVKELEPLAASCRLRFVAYYYFVAMMILPL